MLDAGRAKALLCWTPAIALDDSLAARFAWFERETREKLAGDQSVIDEELKAILVCPACKGDFRFEEAGSSVRPAGRRTPIRDGIPVMLIDEAQPWMPGG